MRIPLVVNNMEPGWVQTGWMIQGRGFGSREWYRVLRYGKEDYPRLSMEELMLLAYEEAKRLINDPANERAGDIRVAAIGK